MAKKKTKKWVRARHYAVRNIVCAVLSPYLKLKGVRAKKFKEQGNRQYLIVMNHQTGYDQFFPGMVFKKPYYFVASEDLFSNGFISRLLSWAIAPIPIKKQASDISAVRTCLQVAKEGGTIAIAPEGNRTYCGRTVYFKESTVKLIKHLKLPVAIMRIEGGYGAYPRWSDGTRRGRIDVYVSRVIEPEEYAQMSNTELFEQIREGINVNEAVCDRKYHGRKLAERLERVMYVCPYCGLSEFESRRDIVKCKKCGRKIRYLPTKELQGVGFDFPHRFVADWYDYQLDYINGLDLNALDDAPLYEEKVRLSNVILYSHKELLDKNARIALHRDRFVVTCKGEKLELFFTDIEAITVLGRNKLNVYHGDKVYQFKGEKGFNALKYMNFCFRRKNMDKGENDDKFLGL